MTRRIAWRSSMGKYVRSGQVNDGSTAGRASRFILPLAPAVGKFAAVSCAIAHAAHGAWHRNPENSHRRHPPGATSLLDSLSAHGSERVLLQACPQLAFRRLET